MVSEKFQELGVIEWMQLLAELHKLGYEKLRWFSYISPNGSAMRCHITTQDNIYANRELVNFSPEYVVDAALLRMSSGDDIKPLLREFIEEFPDSLLEKGKGADKDYAEWFDRILSRALTTQELPRFYGEFFPAALGHIMIGDEICRTQPMRIRIISWNIDGLKAHFESLKQICHKYDPDIICLQKVKDSKTSKEFDLPGYNRVQSNAPYAGVATYTKFYLGGETDSQPDTESLKGHLLRTTFRYPRFTLFNVYVPYSNPQVPGAVEKCERFDSIMVQTMTAQHDRIVMCGDMNIVHTELDCWDGKYRRKQANFHDWERQNFDRLLQHSGMIDTYRTMHPSGREFTYFFRNDPQVRAQNRGHRIDYFLASESLLPEITSAEILQDITASTNNPILLEFSY